MPSLLAMTEEAIDEIFKQVQPFTLTGKERIRALIEAVEYLVANNIPGDFVECGVWRGGSLMAALETLRRLGSMTRRIWLFDTFSGMTDPGAEDTSVFGEVASEMQNGFKQKGEKWCFASLADVQANLKSIEYPEELLKFVVGTVEETLTQETPSEIALLRLDTDWYTSTRLELEMLYPKLVRKGVLIIDDYGHWRGAKRAVDEFFEAQEYRPLLNRVDYTCRLVVKP
jgi:O-methyltransferase